MNNRKQGTMNRTISRRTFLHVAGLGTAAAVLAACGPGQIGGEAGFFDLEAPVAVPEAVAESEAMEAGFMRPEGTPKRSGIVKTAFGVTVAHFDIHQGGGAHVLGHMYNGLVRYDLTDGLRTIIPDLATSWEVSDDGLTYTFTLREGVQYHDGEPFGAKDVVATFSRILNPPEGITSPFQGDLSMVDSVEEIDDLTVQFNLNAPRSYFLNLLSATNYVIYSKKSLEENNFDLREVVAPGTGAFKYVNYLTAEKWVLERNENYWDSELPYIDGVEMIHVPAWSDRGTAVLTEQANMSWNVAFETWVEGESRADEIGVNKLPGFGAYWIVFNNNKAPFDDPRVRRAVHLAVSKQDMIKAFSTQEQINLTSWVPHGDTYATAHEQLLETPGYREDKSEDIEMAKQLLAEAGYPDGIDDVELLAASVAPHSELLAPAFQDQLKRTLNINATIRVTERALLKDEQRNGNFQIVLDTYGHSVSDIAPRANLWWKTGGSQNFSGYSNPDFDALLEQIESELDVDSRAEMIAQAQAMLDENPPWYLIGYTFHLPMWRSYVKGVSLDNRLFTEWGRFETIWLDQ
ncbi:twin-arginine translocation signal domain-containing protein [Chloroflexi bacterium TSY]|nr:twin-arginine translocation signal domain-containing protein [Chloroflexi bacterium TSY]